MAPRAEALLYEVYLHADHEEVGVAGGNEAAPVSPLPAEPHTLARRSQIATFFSNAA